MESKSLDQWVADLDTNDWEILATALLHMGLNDRNQHSVKDAERALVLSNNLNEALLE